MKSLRKAPALAALVGLAQLTCHQVILTAPPGSSLTCDVNPTFIAANGDIAVVSVLIFDPTGFPVADGTVVQFFTDLGKIPEQAKTNDGVARVNFMSDSRSGRANIQAFSGGAATGGGSTTTTTATTVRVAPPDGAASFAAGSLAAGSNIMAACPSVAIGSARPKAIVVTASPERITKGQASEIVANVSDEFGNPVVNVPIFFKVENPQHGTLDSGGGPVYTDNNGRARDVFRTKLGPEAGPIRAKVEAFTPTGVTNFAFVQIN